MRALCIAAWALALTISAAAAGEKDRQVVDVWPGPAPGETAPLPPEKIEPSKSGSKPILIASNVSRPTLTVFPAPAEKNTGAAVIIAPGGGYNILAWDLEGTEVAEWLNSLGVSAFVLKYRVPRRPGQPGDKPPVGPLQDAQRAMSLVRSRAKEWKLDPDRIGMLGFSAGGHLTATTATGFDRRAYEPRDAVDEVSCRPDFVVLIYPAYLAEKGELKPDLRVSARTPPTFLAHAGDDPVSPENSIAYYLALKRAGVPAELHVYGWGGHGFGLRPADAPSWPQRCEEWMRRRGLLKRAG